MACRWAAAEERENMAVYLQLAGNKEIDQHKDDNKTVFAYQVSEAGVLTILVSEPDGGAWTVTRQHSPSSWVEVSGKRFVGPIDELGGFLGGSAKAAAPWHAVAD
jgi:nitrogen fixation protein FixH